MPEDILTALRARARDLFRAQLRGPLRPLEAHVALSRPDLTPDVGVAALAAALVAEETTGAPVSPALAAWWHVLARRAVRDAQAELDAATAAALRADADAAAAVPVAMIAPPLTLETLTTQEPCRGCGAPTDQALDQALALPGGRFVLHAPCAARLERFTGDALAAHVTAALLTLAAVQGWEDFLALAPAAQREAVDLVMGELWELMLGWEQAHGVSPAD